MGDIAHLQPTNGLGDAWLYDGPRGQAMRTEIFSPDGQLTGEDGSTVTPSDFETDIHVNFTTKTWWQQSFHTQEPQVGPRAAISRRP